MKNKRHTRGYKKADGTRVRSYDSAHQASTPTTHSPAVEPARHDDGWNASVDKSAYMTGALSPAEIDVLIAGRNPAALIHVARRRDLSRHQQLRLADDREAAVRFWLAENPRARPEIVDQLSRDWDASVREAALANAVCPPDALIDAYRSPHEELELKAMSVAHPNAPTELIRTAAADSDPVLRSAAIGRWDAPRDVLEAAAQSTDPLNRMLVAENPGSGPELIARLAQDSRAEVRAACAGNALSIDDDTLDRLEHDDDERVRAVAHQSQRLWAAIDDRPAAA